MANGIAIYQWILANWTEIVQAITSIIGVASIIVKLTPGMADDNALLGVVKFLGKYIALNVSREDKVKVSK